MTEMHEHEAAADGLGERLGRIEKRMTDLWDEIDRSARATIEHMRPFLEELERTRDAVKGMLRDVRGSTGEHGREMARRAKAELDGMEDEVSAATHELQEQLSQSGERFREAAKKEIDAWRSRLDHVKEHRDVRSAAREELDQLRERAEHAYNEAKARIERFSDEGEEDLEIIRTGAGRALEELRSTVRELRTRERSAAA